MVVKGKDVGETGRRDGGDAGERRIMAVGKRVKNRWLIEMSVTSPRSHSLPQSAKAVQAA
jgi:hypothetical protein